MWATAYRWAAYWKERVNIFGDDDARAWGASVLDLSSCSAEETAALVSGVIVPDAHRNVLYVDRSKEPHNLNGKITAKMLFFWLHVLAMKESGPTASDHYKQSPTTFSIVLSQADLESVGTSNIQQIFGLQSRIFPMSLQAVHVIADSATSINDNTECKLGDLPQVLQQRLIYHTDRSNLSEPPYSLSPPMDKSSFSKWLQTRGASVVPTVPAHDLKTTTAALPEESAKEEEEDSKPSGRSESSVASSQAKASSTVAVAKDDELSFVETSAIQDQGQKQVEEAIENMPADQKEAYLQALEVCPELVQHESPSLWFLRYDHYDSWKAAERLAYYWKRRVEIFGDRAFRPMSQTGYGTLSPAEIEVLRTGYLAVLPEASSGQSVVCYDASRLPGDDQETRIKRLRCFFYFCSVLMEEEINRSYGCFFIGILSHFSLTRSFGLHQPGLLFEKAFPIVARQIHAVRCQATSLPLLKSVLPTLLKYIRTGANRTTFHLGNEAEVLESLNLAGFPASKLPEQVGGKWTYEDFTEWCDERCQFELERYPRMRPAMNDDVDCTEEIDEKKKLAQSVLEAFVDSREKEEKASRRRKLRVAYSRQKRKRQKNMLNSLHEQVYDLQNMKTFLVEENKKLEKLMTLALEVTQPYTKLGTIQSVSANKAYPLDDRGLSISGASLPSNPRIYFPSIPHYPNLQTTYPTVARAMPSPFISAAPGLLSQQKPKRDANEFERTFGRQS